MGFTTYINAPLGCIPYHLVICRKHWLQSSLVCCRWETQTSRSKLTNKRKNIPLKSNFGGFTITAHAGQEDSIDTNTEIMKDEDAYSFVDGEVTHDELMESTMALSEAISRQEAIEKERNLLIEELARLETKQQDYAEMIKHNKGLAISELQAAKSLFNQKLQVSIEEILALEWKLVLAKQDVVELAVQVEKLAELAFPQAASHILEDTWLTVSAAETTAAEAGHHIEEQIRSATECIISSIVDQLMDTINKALSAAEQASTHAKKAIAAITAIFYGKCSSEEDVNYLINGGRIDLLTDDDSQKWKRLAEVPRRVIPEWLARRIRAIFPKFPPKNVNISEALSVKSLPLNLSKPDEVWSIAQEKPKPDEVWSIAQEKPKQIDVIVEHVIEKEAIEKKRKALESALQRKTVKWQRTPEHTKLEPGTGTGREIVFQGFNWESWRRQWYLELAPKAADLSHSGITAVWFPPPTESVAPQGYMPLDLYNLNSAYGSTEELKHCIEEMHAQDLLALGDVVLNHRCAHKQSPNGVWNIFGGKLAWGPEAIVCDDPNFQGCGNPSTGDIFHAAPNIDHSQEFIRRDVKEWLNWLRNDIGFDGWRLDFARGFSGGYVREFIEASNPAFAIGEYWDSLAYEGGNLCYNQDAHRQRIVNWINATGGTSSAFDVTTKGILHSALHNQYWRLIDPQGKPTGVMGWWPSRAVTFLENHDTGSTQGHWPFPREKLAQGYAYILTHPGTPVIFYDHFYDFGLRDTITELIEARKRAGVHCRSPIKIYHANNEGYVAQVNDSLVIKLGHFDWNPSKENNLDGTWQKFLDKSCDYQIWLRQ